MGGRLRRTTIRMLGFCLKELQTVLQQPLLVASLTLGPFIVLLLFGLGYRGPHPVFRTVLVIPEASQLAVDPEVYREAITGVFDLVEVTRDEAAARARLEAGEIDVVAVVPPEAPELIYRGEQAALRVLFTEIDPTSAAWVHFFTQTQASELNRRVLLEVIRQTQGSIEDVPEFIAQANTTLDAIETDLENGNRASAAARVAQLLLAVRAARVSVVGTADTPADADADGPGQAASLLVAFEEDLIALQREIATGDDEAALTRIEGLRGRLERLENVAEQLTEIPPRTLVSPFIGQAENVTPVEPSAIAFYTPAAVALLLQHIAVTLTSLSAVRDRLLGSLDWLRVSPSGPSSILVGKSLGYGLLLVVVAAALTLGALIFLNVPLVGSPLLYVVSVLLVIFAATGLGFALSVVASSETQAVQLSLLVLLFSIFLGGFFLPLNLFFPWVKTVSYVLPVTFGAIDLRDVMLRGITPAWPFLVGPLALGLVYYAIAAFGLQRQMRRA